MKKKGTMTILIVFHIIVLISILLFKSKLDVVVALGYTYIPILISLGICIINKVIKKDIPSKLDLILMIPNIIYIIMISFIISFNLNQIYEESQKYTSTYIDVNINDSPLSGIVLFVILSIALHYFVIMYGKNKIKDRGQETFK